MQSISIGEVFCKIKIIFHCTPSLKFIKFTLMFDVSVLVFDIFVMLAATKANRVFILRLKRAYRM